MRKGQKEDQELRERIARNIWLGRQLAGLTQEQLGEKVGVKRTQIAIWENARRKPETVAILALANALHQDFDWFFAEHDTTPATP
jgi:transcriptional regulator with XRE-family HTH domain